MDLPEIRVEAMRLAISRAQLCLSMSEIIDEASQIAVFLQGEHPKASIRGYGDSAFNSPCVNPGKGGASHADRMHCHRIPRPSERSPRRAVLLSVADIGQHNAGVGKARRDFERAAEGFDVAAQIAHMHVGALFELRHGGLAHRESLGHVFL